MPKFCPTCGLPLQYENVHVCPHCGTSIQYAPAPPEWKEIRSTFLAVLLSFLFVGWGQWYDGKTWSGLKFFGAFWGFYVLLLLFSYMTSIRSSVGIFVVIFLVLMTGIWVFGMYDAYKTAARINREKESFSGKSELFWFPVGLVILVVFIVFLAFIFGTTDALFQFIIVQQQLLTNDSVLF